MRILLGVSLSLDGTMMIGHLVRFKMPVTTLPLKRWYRAPWPWEPRMM